MWKQKSAVNERNFDSLVVLIDSEKALLHELNSVGSRIWSLCDGAHSAQQMAVILSEEFDVSVEEAEQDLHHFLARMSQMGLLESLDGEGQNQNGE